MLTFLSCFNNFVVTNPRDFVRITSFLKLKKKRRLNIVLRRRLCHSAKRKGLPL